jgi:hypothetical protein
VQKLQSSTKQKPWAISDINTPKIEPTTKKCRLQKQAACRYLVFRIAPGFSPTDHLG